MSGRPAPAGSRGGGNAKEEVSAGGIVFRWIASTGSGPRPVYLLIRDSYRNWGFPKGHLEQGEAPEGAAVREVEEETGLDGLAVYGAIETIDWYFRFRGRLIHKVCHFFLMRSELASTCPQRDEGITACRWATYDEAITLVSYANAREVLRRAHEMVDRLDGDGAPRAAPATPTRPERAAGGAGGPEGVCPPGPGPAGATDAARGEPPER